ncbi:hypothetical protein AB1Y20_015581 [Prymnesium parvum]|uniref:Uncharacterized protein n=1 Tax=Prymnesium parvum TaxID=97485 RepID=A0AB34JYA1_PRYPA
MARTPSPSSRRRGGDTLPPGMCFYEVTVPAGCYVGETLYARIVGQDEIMCLAVPEGVEAGDILVFAAEVGWGQQEPSCSCGERRRQRGAARASVVRGAWRTACRKLSLLPIVVAQRTVRLGGEGQSDDLTDRRVAQALQESIPRLSRRTEDGEDVYIEGAAGETLFEIEVPVLLPPAPSEILPGALLQGDTIMEVKVDSTAHRAGVHSMLSRGCPAQGLALRSSSGCRRRTSARL